MSVGNLLIIHNHKQVILLSTYINSSDGCEKSLVCDTYESDTSYRPILRICERVIKRKGDGGRLIKQKYGGVNMAPAIIRKHNNMY